MLSFAENYDSRHAKLWRKYFAMVQDIIPKDTFSVEF